MKRRDFLRSASAATGGAIGPGFGLWLGTAPAVITAEKLRPQMPEGVQSGDVTSSRAVLWSRSDRPARMMVEYATNPAFQNVQRRPGPTAHESTDFTARIDLSGLPPGQEIFYRITFQNLADPAVFSEPVTGKFRTAPTEARETTFVWGGDVCGQGWGINPDFGGMKIFESMRALQPDFFLHSGDSIYADGVLQPEVTLNDGSIWKNLVVPAKSKVAETLEEFRGNHRYNLLDDNLRRFHAEVPVLAQWDDHEVRNNWYPNQILDDPRYTVKSVDALAARGRQAFMEYTPIRFNPRDPERIFRAFHHGPLLDVIMLDERSYRGPNTQNRQSAMSRESAFLGNAQLKWIEQQLLKSKAAWKVIASDMPIGIIVPDAGGKFENVANGDGPPLGRELEMAEFLRFLKRHNIRNVVWLTADVHYTAAQYYDPAKAQFTDFDPFWEFVAGPLHAGTGAAAVLDNTFGPQVKFIGAPARVDSKRSPKEGLQFFGSGRIDAKTRVLTIGLHNLWGEKIYSVDLPPA